jgi:hypothetical protein
MKLTIYMKLNTQMKMSLMDEIKFIVYESYPMDEVWWNWCFR